MFLSTKNVHLWIRSTYPSFLCGEGLLSGRTDPHTYTHRCIEPHYIHKTYVNETEAIIPFPQWSLILSPSYPEHPFITSACVLDPAQGDQQHDLRGRALSHLIRFHQGKVLNSRYRRQGRMQFIKLLARIRQTDYIQYLCNLKFNNNNVSAALIQDKMCLWREIWLGFGCTYKTKLSVSLTLFRPA